MYPPSNIPFSNDSVRRPKRSKKTSQKPLNDIAAGLNTKTVEDYIHNIITDTEHPEYLDVNALREYLKDSTVSLNEIRGDIGETLLFNIALIKDEQKALDIMQFMIEEQGLFAYSEDDLQQTVLYYLCREGKTRCIEYLIERGCSINHTDIYKQTPLYYAVRDNRLTTVRKLVEMCGSEEERK